MRVGSFHSGEVPSVAGKNWLGMFVDGERTELRAVAPRIKTVFDGINDDESNKASYTGKEVSLKGPEHLLVLRRSGLESGTIVQARLSDTDHGQTAQFENISYEILHKCKAKNKETGFQSCKVYVVGKGVSQWLGDTNEHSDSDFAETIRIVWAGGLDRDGKVDFIVEKSRYNNSDTILMLSSAAKGKQHALEVARLSQKGC